MDRETKHKLLDLVLDSKHDGVDITFASPRGRGYSCTISVYDWADDKIIGDRHFNFLSDVGWDDQDLNRYTIQEIMEILEETQDAEH